MVLPLWVSQGGNSQVPEETPSHPGTVCAVAQDHSGSRPWHMVGLLRELTNEQFEAELLAIKENSNRHAARSAGWVLEYLTQRLFQNLVADTIRQFLSNRCRGILIEHSDIMQTRLSTTLERT